MLNVWKKKMYFGFIEHRYLIPKHGMIAEGNAVYKGNA
jgi:hypothetical protein